jgi:plasmid stabilization system protein ParE
MKIIYAPRALRDVAEILAYIGERSPRGAHRISVAIEKAIGLCARHRGATGRTDEPGVYRHPLGKYRYTIFYRVLVDEAGIEVARVVRSGRVKNLNRIPDNGD